MTFFPDVPTIAYEGPSSKNPLAFRHYRADEVIEGKSMREHLRFADRLLAHASAARAATPSAPACALRPWEDGSDSVDMAVKTRPKVAFEFMHKLGVDFYCFHDRDVAPDGVKTLSRE